MWSTVSMSFDPSFGEVHPHGARRAAPRPGGRVPPDILDLISQWQTFIHDDEDGLDPLVKCALFMLDALGERGRLLHVAGHRYSIIRPYFPDGALPPLPPAHSLLQIPQRRKWCGTVRTT